jgi:filamentous hemagglutinin
MKPKRFYSRSTSIFSTPLKYGVPIFVGFTVLISGLDAQAGDILRGSGGSSSNKSGRPATSGAATPAATSAARKNAKDTLARTTKTLASIKAMQKAARKVAKNNGSTNLGKDPRNSTVNLPDVPNGLALGGLNVSAEVALDPSKWSGASLPTQKVTAKGKTNVTIKQTAQQALLEWETFNVGKITKVTFDQSDGGADVGKWIAFNKVTDPTGNPTQVLGKIKADGQIYLINQNGIIFGGGSQVNARGLTASSLPINDNLIDSGLLNNPDAQFLFSGLAIPGGINGTPAFTPETALDISGKYGDVTVQEGAVLKSPSDSAKVGGRITLVGPNVTNNGSILTPDGQTILAAGLQVGFDAHSANDPSLRGLDVFVGAVEDPVAGLHSGTVFQDGLVEAQRGSINLSGKDIRLDGMLFSTTSVSFNGRIDIRASYNAMANRGTSNARGDLFLFKDSGAVEIAPDSVISVLPDYASKETTIGKELALRSQVNLSGKTIHVGENSAILLPNGQASLNAGTWFFDSTSAAPTSRFVQTGGQVYFEKGVILDVSGSKVDSIPVSQNIISVDLRGAELANSPLQRQGNLRGKTVEVDIRDAGIYQGDQWLGTPLANVAGFANLISRSVGQLTVEGGTVNITAGASVVMQKGSRIDVSGGSTTYEAGMVRTTQLITGNRLVDISQATPDYVYDGIYDGTFSSSNTKFGIQNVFLGALTPGGNRFDPGSTEGAAGGKLSISAASMALDGRLLGKTTTGDRQRLSPPATGSLSLSFQSQDISYPSLPFQSLVPPTVFIDTKGRQAAAEPFGLDVNGDPLMLAEDRLDRVFVAPNLMARNGFGVLEVDNHDGDIVLSEGVLLETAPGGAITLSGSNVTLDGTIVSPGGRLSIFTHGLTLAEINAIRNAESVPQTPPVVQEGRGVFSLGSKALLSTAGLIVDDRLSSGPPSVAPVNLDGGSITIQGYSAILAKGGKVDVSGGGLLDGRGSVKYGDGGSISISAGREIGFSSTLGGVLDLRSDLSGLSGGASGSLAISGPAIQIGGNVSDPRVALFQPKFFSQGGFGSISMSGIGLATVDPDGFIPGVLVNEGTKIDPVVNSLIAKIGRKNEFLLRELTKPEGLRSQIHLTFAANGAAYQGVIQTRGDVVVESGSVIRTDGGGSVSFNGETVTLAGSVIAPGGSISVAGAGSYPTNVGVLLDFALPTVHLAGSARLSAAGKLVRIVNSLGLRSGNLLAGGTIKVTGNFVAESGSVLDVSGARGVMDLLPSQASLKSKNANSTSGRTHVPVKLESNAGTIALGGSQMLLTDATLVGEAGGRSATGGVLQVGSGRFVPVDEGSTTADINLVVVQQGLSIPAGNLTVGTGVPVLDNFGNPVPQLGNLSVERFTGGGFDSVSLLGNVSFAGDVAIRVPGTLSVADGGVILADSNVMLHAGHALLGQAFRPPTQQQAVVLFTQVNAGSSNVLDYTFGPTHGAGRLTVTADLIDVGDLSLQGIGAARIIALGGDVRGNGTFEMAGDLTIKAGQIYPPTQRSFNIFAYDHDEDGELIPGSVSIRRGGQRSLPFSAGGELSIYASEINQNGTLRAPVGTITVGWDGSGAAPLNPIAGTTVAAPIASLLTLGKRSITSVSAIDPLTGEPGIIPFGISLDGSSWIDPSGTDITVSGAPEKRVNLAAVNLITLEGSKVDIRGGGDLFAYRWISGNGGTKDILASKDAFAVIPGYGFNYAPYALFNDDSAAVNLGGEPGYVNSRLKVGDQITLASSRDLPGGTYTLLPARYALLEGGILITPTSGLPINSTRTAEGAQLVSGYLSNNLNESRKGATAITRFEIASAKVFRERAEYQELLGNTFLRESAIAKEFVIPRLSVDSGYVSFSSTADMSLEGLVSSEPATGGKGGLIDINSTSAILINRKGDGGSEGELVLKSSQLNQFGAESLLVGGLRTSETEGSSITVNTSSLTLDNRRGKLRGSDIILVSNGAIELTKGSAIVSTPNDKLLFETLLLGDEDVVGSGDGSLLRASANASGGIIRAGLGGSTSPVITVSEKVRIKAGSIILDSTASASVATNSSLNGKDVSLGAGRISLLLSRHGSTGADAGLILSGKALSSVLEKSDRISLASYSTLDTYGRGTIGANDFEQISLHAGAIRGFNAGSGKVSFRAHAIDISNTLGSVAGAATGTLQGSLEFAAKSLSLETGNTTLDGFARNLISSKGVLLTSEAGALESTGNLTLSAGLITGESASDYHISAVGTLDITKASGNRSSAPGGIGAKLSLLGATVDVSGNISLSSGRLDLAAFAGDLTIGQSGTADIDLGGASVAFGDVFRYTDGGTAILKSAGGSVVIGEKAVLSVSAPSKGGDAGLIEVSAPSGRLDLLGEIDGAAGTGGAKGNFSLDAATLTGGKLSSLSTILNEGSFTNSRAYRIRTGDVLIDGSDRSRYYSVSADAGDIIVSGDIDASGATGGTIDLKANGSLIVQSGVLLDASGRKFDSAGKGGSITLESGSQRDGVIDPDSTLDLQSGSIIDLSIASKDSTSASLGQFSGTLHLRAPRTTDNKDLRIEAIGSKVKGASSVLLEGVKLYGLTGAGTITTTVQNSINTDANNFLGLAGTSTAGYTAMLERLTALDPSLDLILAPGAEVFNLTGDLTLGTATSATSSDWNLEKFRFGPLSAPGVLTLRAKGDVVLYNALSDGFAGVAANNNNGNSTLWLAPLMARNELLAINSQSWSYRITSGADFSSANFRSVLSESELEDSKGSFRLGKNYGNAASFGSGQSFVTSTAIRNRYQVLRTGSGDIDIHAGGDVLILNQFASIYSAGTLVSNPTTVQKSGDFTLPVLLGDFDLHPTQGSLLGAVQQPYIVQYSMAGGNVSISAGNDIARMTRNSNSATAGTLIDDSSRQLPNNWLYRRGYIDPVTGEAGVAGVDEGFIGLVDPAASTSWWIEFSNFFEGVGTLGGGNIVLNAGHNVRNVDAVAPTNARIASGKPSASKLVELGGGDLTVIAGNDLDGGVYYVERGKGILRAGGQITTNASRSPSRGIVASLTNPLVFDSNTWLPTTLFLGKGSFDVQAAGDLLMGQVANTFLLPQGINNKYWYKTYFNTYDPGSGVDVISLGGSITHRTRVSLPAESSTRTTLDAWISTQQSLSASNGAASFQPWLRSVESNITPFSTVSSLMAPTLHSTALGGSINLAGDITLFPSAKGQIELVARDSISGLQPSGAVNNLGGVQRWISSNVNISDANPLSVPGINSPYAYLQVVGRSSSGLRLTGSGVGAGFLGTIDGLFQETGSSSGALEAEQARHTPGGLHKGDTEPVRIYAVDGSIDGLNLFSPKQTRVVAGLDIGDVSLYIQNMTSSDVSLVSAGRDLIPYNENTVSRSIANADISSNPSVSIQPLAGDIQISGPGTLEVLAGRDLDLGLGGGNSDGTGTGITSIGNARNPYLRFDGADLTIGVGIGAGIGAASGLSGGNPDFGSFIRDFVLTDEGRKYLKEVAPGVDFESATAEEQAGIALDVFYLTIRDAGRDFNDPKSPGFGKYANGMKAIKALFPKSIDWSGEILTQSRDIRTLSGGDISIFAPGGGLTMANTTIGNPLTPPGIVTESGGDISIFTDQNVDIGIGRIFTLRGGNAVIWSSNGDIAAGSSSRTVSAAPPTRVLIDPQSASVETDLAGLATGGGIGVLATVEGVAPGDVDLIAPSGIIDAGDAGIRVSGNINLAAVTVVNAGNISAAGNSTGTPTTTVSGPSVSVVSAASKASAASTSTSVTPVGQKPAETAVVNEDVLSIITVEVIGYGGGGATDDENEENEASAQ